VSHVEAPYPRNIFPEDRYRRVLGHLPAPHTKAVRDENFKDRAELWKDEPVDPAPYPTGYGLTDLLLRLSKSDVYDDMALTEGEVRGALEWNAEQGYVETKNDEFRMTKAGLKALCE
jgi:hypothetical protein